MLCSVRACVRVCARAACVLGACVRVRVCVRVCLVWMSPSVRVRTPGCPSPARTGQASLAREEGTLLLAGFNLELAGSPVPSQIYEIAWACTADPVLNLVLLLNHACSCTISTAVVLLVQL